MEERPETELISIPTTPRASTPEVLTPSGQRSPRLLPNNKTSAAWAPASFISPRCLSPISTPMKRVLVNMKSYLEEVSHLTRLNPQDVECWTSLIGRHPWRWTRGGSDRPWQGRGASATPLHGGASAAPLFGEGGFGYVHKGVLQNGNEVAVKSLKAGSGQGEREFQAEVEIISRVHHCHLVSLVGYCISGGQRMLVYEFIPNKTLEYRLYGE